MDTITSPIEAVKQRQVILKGSFDFLAGSHSRVIAAVLIAGSYLTFDGAACPIPMPYAGVRKLAGYEGNECCVCCLVVMPHAIKSLHHATLLT